LCRTWLHTRTRFHCDDAGNSNASRLADRNQHPGVVEVIAVASESSDNSITDRRQTCSLVDSTSNKVSRNRRGQQPTSQSTVSKLTECDRYLHSDPQCLLEIQQHPQAMGDAQRKTRIALF
jgi:hypothetical protein